MLYSLNQWIDFLYFFRLLVFFLPTSFCFTPCEQFMNISAYSLHDGSSISQPAFSAGPLSARPRNATQIAVTLADQWLPAIGCLLGYSYSCEVVVWSK